MSIIHIFGAAGSGTSTLGLKLQERYNYLQLDTDDYFWMPTDPPFIQKRPVEDRLDLISQDITKSDKIVISGSLCGWGDALIPKFDLVIRLVVPTEIRIERLEKREFLRFGKRIRAGGDMYEIQTEFLKWASEYDTGASSMRSKAMHDEWQTKITCKQMTLDGTLSADELINEIALGFSL